MTAAKLGRKSFSTHLTFGGADDAGFSPLPVSGFPILVNAFCCRIEPLAIRVEFLNHASSEIFGAIWFWFSKGHQELRAHEDW